MKSLTRFITVLLCLTLGTALTQAQAVSDKQQDAPATNTIAQDVLIIIQQEQVRFTSRSPGAEMQLRIFDQAGQLIHDSGTVTAAELTWVLRQANGEAVKSGLYAYSLAVKEAGAADARVRRGHFIVDRAEERDGKTDRLWITSQNEGGVGTELTVARSEGETIAGTSATGERRGVRAEQGRARDGEAETKKEGDGAAAAAANGTRGRLAKFTSESDLGNSVMTELNGNIGIGTTTPATRLEVAGNWTGEDGALRVSGDKPTIRFTGGPFSGNQSWLLHLGSNGPGNLEFLRKTGASVWNPVLSMSPSGNVGIGTDAPTHKLEIIGQPGLRIAGYQPFLTLTDTNNGFVWDGRIQNVNGGLNFQTHDLTWLGGTAMYIQNGTQNVGIGTSAPQYKLDVNGITRTNLLMITGGADFAENFDVNAAVLGSEAMTPNVEAGMVVSIDPASPGKLQLSTRAYDRRVAGIISGAGGVKPGMVMNQEGTLADGRHPVALSGRVYAWVDASQGAIDPGDLLTTSSTPGHAMKAADAAKAQGAIIGKAMTGLKEGRGLVLVLVTLQ